MTDKWLTVAQVAQHLGISERQARRYASRLSPQDRDDGADAAPDTGAAEAGLHSVTRPARRPARVRLEAMCALRDEATRRENGPATLDSQADTDAGREPDIQPKDPDMAPDTGAEEAGHPNYAASGPPDVWEQRESDFRDEIRFLRGMVEQHQRSEAELRAALREALKAQPRQLTGSDEPLAPVAGAPPETSTAAPPTTAAPLEAPKAPREPIKTQRQRAVRGLFRAFLGINNGDE